MTLILDTNMFWTQYKNTEKGETDTGHKYVLNSIQAHMLVPKTKLDHLSGKGRLTGEQVDAIKRDLQVRLEHLDVLKCYFYSLLGYIVSHVFWGYLGLFAMSQWITETYL